MPTNVYAAYGGSTAEILRLFFDTDETSIDITTTSTNPAVTEPKPSFHFSSFSQAARDNSLSMIYSGWDFRKSVSDGEEMGRQIAGYVFTHHFLAKAYDTGPGIENDKMIVNPYFDTGSISAVFYCIFTMNRMTTSNPSEIYFEFVFHTNYYLEI